MATIHLLVGVPGSGKSTFAKKLQNKYHYPIISSDEVRNNHPDWAEDKIFPEVYRLSAEYLKQNIDIIYDATNATAGVRNHLFEEIKKYDIEFTQKAYYFPIDYQSCLKRIAKRNKDPQERFFPLEALKAYCDKIVAPSIDEGFMDVEIIEQYDIKDIPQKLLKGLIVNDRQGYAFYFQDNEDIIEKYQGFENLLTNSLVNKFTNFRLASCSKQFIAYAIYQLIKQNLLTFDTKLNSILDLGEYANDITIKHLLNHTSGLPDYEDMPHTDEQIHDIDVLKYLKTLKSLKFTPGTNYAYSNSGFVLLGLIIEKITSKSINEYIEKEIFEKIGMLDSCVNIQGITKIKNRAYGQGLVNNELQTMDQYWCSATIGDGGLYSSVNDLIKWLDFLYSIYNKEEVFFKPNYLPDGTNTEYCLGIRHIEKKGISIIYHCGETIGTNTVIGFIPEENKKFIFLTNYDGIDAKEVINNLIEIL